MVAVGKCVRCFRVNCASGSSNKCYWNMNHWHYLTIQPSPLNDTFYPLMWGKLCQWTFFSWEFKLLWSYVIVTVLLLSHFSLTRGQLKLKVANLPHSHIKRLSTIREMDSHTDPLVLGFWCIAHERYLCLCTRFLTHTQAKIHLCLLIKWIKTNTYCLFLIWKEGCRQREQQTWAHKKIPLFYTAPIRGRAA